MSFSLRLDAILARCDAFDESKYERIPKGQPGAGRWRKRGGGSAGTSAESNAEPKPADKPAPPAPTLRPGRSKNTRRRDALSRAAEGITEEHRVPEELQSGRGPFAQAVEKSLRAAKSKPRTFASESERIAELKRIEDQIISANKKAWAAGANWEPTDADVARSKELDRQLAQLHTEGEAREYKRLGIGALVQRQQEARQTARRAAKTAKQQEPRRLNLGQSEKERHAANLNRLAAKHGPSLSRGPIDSPETAESAASEFLREFPLGPLIVPRLQSVASSELRNTLAGLKAHGGDNQMVKRMAFWVGNELDKRARAKTEGSSYSGLTRHDSMRARLDSIIGLCDSRRAA